MSDCSIPDTYEDGTSDTMFDMSVSMSVDTDQDGYAETTIVDFEGDGVADAYDMIDPTTGAETVIFDADGDGFVDTIVTDTDGDMVFDEGASDSDGDGELDSSFDPNTGEVIDGPFPQLDDGTTDITATEASDGNDDGNADGNDDGSDDDAVHGDSMAEIPYHQAQAGANDCLPTSVAMVLSEITGAEVPAGDVVDLANELGLLGETGMSLEGGLALLDHYGIDAEVQTSDIDGLRTMLDAGTPVIIGLDSDDLYGTGDSPFADDLVAGHAVVITGIDDEAGVVYINDPGFPDGAGVAISIEAFEDAWADSDHSMIVAEAGAATAGDTAAEEEVGGLVGSDESVRASIARFVLLPFDLVLR